MHHVDRSVHHIM